MENTTHINKGLVAAVLVSYLFIVMPLEKWDLLLGQVLLLSPLGLPYFPDIIYFPCGVLAFILTTWLLISKKPVTGKTINLIRLSLFAYYVPLVIYHCIEPFSINRYDFWICIIPEIAFIILSGILLMQTFTRKFRGRPLQ